MKQGAVRVIISDWGNTIQRFHLDPFFNWLEWKFGVPRRYFWSIFSRHPGGLIHAYEYGQPTAQFLNNVWKEIFEIVVWLNQGRRVFLPAFDDLEFLEHWYRVWDPHRSAPELIRLFQNLKAAGYRLFVLSNTNEAHVASVRDIQFYGRKWSCAVAPVLKSVDRFIASCDPNIRCRKMRPEDGTREECEQIFRKALAIIGVSFKEAVFIDDIEPFCEVFRRMGGHAIHFKGSWTRVEWELEDMGVRWE